jgi:hypothetical protein
MKPKKIRKSCSAPIRKPIARIENVLLVSNGSLPTCEKFDSMKGRINEKAQKIVIKQCKKFQKAKLQRIFEVLLILRKREIV